MPNAESTSASDAPMTVFSILRALARRGSDGVAVEGLEGPPLKRGELLRAVSGMASSLRARGIGIEDRVAVVLPGGPELAVIYLGVASAAVFAPLNPAYTASEYEFYLGDLRPRLLLTGLDAGEEASAVATRLGIPVVRIIKTPGAAAGLIGVEGDARQAAPRPDLPEPDEVALVLHTSGTTSRPKVVPLTHRNLCTSARNIGSTLRLGESDRSLVVMPLFHIHGLVSSVLAALAAGGSIVVPPGFFAPEFLDWMDRFRPTWYTASPTIHQSVLARAKAAPERVPGHSFRFIRTGAAATPPALHHEIEGVFGVPVIEFLGMTEAARQITSNPLPPGVRKPGSVGPPDGAEVAIMDPAGEILTQRSRGEIVVRGENVTPGYADNPAANEASCCNGWFRTGDEGSFDADGYLWVSGRLKEMINRGGEKVWPREVDEVLLDHPAVA